MSQPNAQGQEESGTGHPAWQEIIDALPEEHREELTPALTPVLEKWDKGVQEQFSQLHSTYDPYKPFLEGNTPEDIQAAIGLAEFIRENPQEAFERMAEMLGVEVEQGQAGELPGSNTGGENEEDPYSDRFSSIEEALGMIAETLVNSQESQQEREEEAQLDQVLQGLQGKYGEFDVNYVTYLIGQEIEPDKAVEQYFKMTGKNPQADNVPPVVGSGGGLPSNRKETSKLSHQDIETLVAQTLTAANQQGG